jgi:hypothetical protein
VGAFQKKLVGDNFLKGKFQNRWMIILFILKDLFFA